MKKLFLIVAVALSGCQTANLGSLTPAQDAQLACLATTAASQLSASYTSPVKSAQIQSNGTVLCTLATGAAVVVTPTK